MKTKTKEKEEEERRSIDYGYGGSKREHMKRKTKTKTKTKEEEEPRMKSDYGGVKFGYGVPREPAFLTDLRLLTDLRDFRDPRVSLIRKKKDKYLLRDKGEQSYYTKMTGKKLKNVDYFTEYGMKAKELQSIEGREEDVLHEKDFFLAKTALEHYNSITKGAEYKLVKCLGHDSKIIQKYTSHCNFIAECTMDQKLELFFAEVIGLQDPEVSVCRILDQSHLSGHCDFCPKEIAHPADASWPSSACCFS